MTDIRVIATGLRFPEGPVALKDGSVALVEIARHGHAAAPTAASGARPHRRRPERAGDRPRRAILRLQQWRVRVDRTGACCARRPAGRLRRRTDRARRPDERRRYAMLYDPCDGFGLRGPNDIVFDGQGGFYFTDLGKTRARDRDWGGVYYARADGVADRRGGLSMLTPNGSAVPRRQGLMSPRPKPRGSGHSTSRRRGSREAAARRRMAADWFSGSAVSSASTASRWTPQATSASRR